MTSQAPVRPRHVVATYPTYEHAQRAVDALSDDGFPVQTTRIVGHDLRSVEYVLGRFGFGKAAAAGAMQGAVLGLFLGFVLGLFTFFEPRFAEWAYAFWGFVIGGVAGAIMGVIGHAATGGRRDFSSVQRIEAAGYDIEVDAEMAADAERALQRLAL